MHYFEFKNPYYSLIRSSSRKKAKEIYGRFVSDEQEPIGRAKEVSRDYALVGFAQAPGEGGALFTPKQVMHHFELEDKDAILLVDRSLI